MLVFSGWPTNCIVKNNVVLVNKGYEKLNLSEGRDRKSRIPYKRKAGLPKVTIVMATEVAQLFFGTKEDLCPDTRLACFNI